MWISCHCDLLDFAIEEVGIPVGRVTTLYMYPLSFFEFIVALGHTIWAKKIILSVAEHPIEEPLHGKLLHLVGIYVAIGGMPEATISSNS